MILDFFNLLKRYLYSTNLAELEQGEIVDKLTTHILNKILDCAYKIQPDLIFICSDNGQNKRANSIVKGYKSNRKKIKTLTEEEKEKDYINYLKKLVELLPVGFLEVKNVEADMIVCCLVKYLEKYENNIKITIVSNDSDFVQLLSKNVNILDWNKDIIDENNWVDKTKNIKGFYFNPKHYALAKSIVGDVSDNIKGIVGWGWKKIFRLFCYIYIQNSTNVNIENVDDLILLLNNLDMTDYELKDEKFVNKAIVTFNDNKDLIHNNMDIIDLNMLETPYIFDIMNQINSILMEKKTFNKNEVLNMLKLDRFGGRSSEEYKKIVEKNSKSMMLFGNIFKKYVRSVALLNHNRKKVDG